MLQSEIYNILGDFIVNSLNINVIEANQNATRDIKPFVTIGITSTINQSYPIRGEVDEYGIQKTYLNKQIVVAFEAYSDTLHESESLLNSLQDLLLTDEYYRYFEDKLIYINTLNGIQSISNIINDYTESRALMECTFRYIHEVNVNVGSIEHIHIKNNTTNSEIIINK